MEPSSELMTVLMQEFNALRAEILARSSAQHTLINLNVSISGTLSGFAIAGGSNTSSLLLLLIPPVSTSIGFLYLDHHTAIQRSGTYIDERIRPQVQSLVNGAYVMSWESFFNIKFWRRKPSQVVFWTPLSVLFILGPIGATIYTATLLPNLPALWAVWGLGVATEAVLFTVGCFMFSQKWIRGYRSGRPTTEIKSS